MQPGRGQGSFWSWDRFIAGSVKFRTNVKSEHQQWSDFLGPFSSDTISIAMFFGHTRSLIIVCDYFLSLSTIGLMIKCVQCDVEVHIATNGPSISLVWGLGGSWIKSFFFSLEQWLRNGVWWWPILVDDLSDRPSLVLFWHLLIFWQDVRLDWVRKGCAVEKRYFDSWT